MNVKNAEGSILKTIQNGNLSPDERTSAILLGVSRSSDEFKHCKDGISSVTY